MCGCFAYREVMNTRWSTQLSFIEKLLVALWLGGTWLVGFMAVPVIFATIDDRVLAGQVAGNIFVILRFFAIAVMVLVFISQMRLGNPMISWLGRTILVVLGLLLLDLLWIHPEMVEFKAQGLAESDPFDQMHHLASTLYTINAIIGVWLYYLMVRQK